VYILGLEAEPCELQPQVFEVAHLLLGLAAAVVGRGREMRHEPFDAGVRRCAQRVGDPRCRLTRSQPAHTAVDLQMVCGGNTMPGRQLVPCADVVQAVDHGRQIVIEHPAPFGGQKIGHHQDAGADAGVAQNRAFFDIADREPARAVRHQRSRNFDSTMAVSISLDDRHHFDVRSDGRPDSLKIAGDLAERDLNPGTVRERSHTSRLQQNVGQVGNLRPIDNRPPVAIGGHRLSFRSWA